MLQNTGSLTIETGKRSQRRTAGLLYSQFYPSIKEVFAAGNVYPFTNTAIETLALDKKLKENMGTRRGWSQPSACCLSQGISLYKASVPFRLSGINAEIFWHQRGAPGFQGPLPTRLAIIFAPEVFPIKTLSFLQRMTLRTIVLQPTPCFGGYGGTSISSVWGSRWCTAFKTRTS